MNEANLPSHEVVVMTCSVPDDGTSTSGTVSVRFLADSTTDNRVSLTYAVDVDINGPGSVSILAPVVVGSTQADANGKIDHQLLRANGLRVTRT